MQHVILTCKNHRELRWMCKEIAWSPGAGYNGMRHIFFLGVVVDTVQSGYARRSSMDYSTFKDGQNFTECECPASDLILAPEQVEG